MRPLTKRAHITMRSGLVTQSRQKLYQDPYCDASSSATTGVRILMKKPSRHMLSGKCYIHEPWYEVLPLPPPPACQRVSSLCDRATKLLAGRGQSVLAVTFGILVTHPLPSRPAALSWREKMQHRWHRQASWERFYRGTDQNLFRCRPQPTSLRQYRSLLYMQISGQSRPSQWKGINVKYDGVVMQMRLLVLIQWPLWGKADTVLRCLLQHGDQEWGGCVTTANVIL